ncbi:hypothetical protein OHW37_08775 [Acinetobacter baumannii]|nr:hypothetical protein [Acinetobacter baumannii]
MTTLNYTVRFQKTVLASLIGLFISQSSFALEELSDAGLSETTGEGIAILPQNTYMVFRGAGANETTNQILTDRTKDTGYINYVPVGPLSMTAADTNKNGTIDSGDRAVGKADIFLYGLALSKSDNDTNTRLASTEAAAAISSWGTAVNPWIFKVATENSVPNFSTTNCSGAADPTCQVTYLALEAPLYEVGTRDTAGLDAYKLKLGLWSDIFVRNPNKINGATDQFNYGDSNGLIGTSTDASRANRLRLQAIWNNFSLNGSRLQLFQTLGGATSAGGMSPFYNDTLGFAGVIRLNSGDASNLRATITANTPTSTVGPWVNRYSTQYTGAPSNNSPSSDWLYRIRSQTTTIDSGNIYLNLADTKTLLMPNNATLNAIRLGSGTLTTAADYQHNIHRDTVTNPFSLILAMRGAEFQAFSRRGRFTTSANVAAANQFADNGLNNQWGLALPFYNLNANAAVYGVDAPANSAYYYTKDANGKPIQNLVATSGTTSRLGFGIAVGTTGRDAGGTKTTSILLIDGSPNVNNAGNPTDYYMGLRNIDMFLKGNGTIGLENGSLNIGLKDMLLALSTEIAAGYLPGAKYKTCPATGSCTSPIDNFAKNNDVLFGLKLRLGGDLNLSIVPNSSIADGSALTVLGDFTMPATATGNTVQISDPIDGSAIGFDNITGKLAFNTALVVGKDTASGLGKVGVNTAVYFNPDKSIDGALRVKDINFYPPSTGAGARLGELAITGGRLNSSFSIVPRNGAFN